MKKEFVWNSSNNEISCKDRLKESDLQLRYFEEEYLNYLNTFDENNDMHLNYINSLTDYNRCLNAYVIEEKSFNNNFEDSDDSEEYEEESLELIDL